MSQTTASQDIGKDANGKFTKGNRYGKGNPFGRRAAEVRARVATLMKDEAVDDIINAQINHARKGDLQAAKFLFGYLIGKPTKCVEPDQVDLEEWDIFKQESMMMTDLLRMKDTPCPVFPVHAMRTLRGAGTEAATALFIHTHNERTKREAKEERDIIRKAKKREKRRLARIAKKRRDRSMADTKGQGAPSSTGFNGENPSDGKTNSNSTAKPSQRESNRQQPPTDGGPDSKRQT